MPKGQIIKVLAGFYYVDTGKKVVSAGHVVNLETEVRSLS